MPSLWIDLLRLHGHINDPEKLHWLASPRPSKPQSEPDTKEATVTMAKRVITSLRRCLGIGDGVLRCQ